MVDKSFVLAAMVDKSLTQKKNGPLCLTCLPSIRANILQLLPIWADGNDECCKNRYR